MLHRTPLLGRHRRAQGFTILELMVVVAIIMILTAAGIGLSSDLVPRYKTRQAAKEFASMVQRCRAIAIQSNRECSIWMVDYDSNLGSLSSNGGEYWVGMGNLSSDSTTWDLLPVDSEADGTDDDNSIGLIDIADPAGNHYRRHVGIAQWDSIAGPGAGNTNRIVFTPRGFLSNPSSDFDSTGSITIAFVNKVAQDAGITERMLVRISRSGMTRISSSVNDVYTGAVSGTTQI